MNTAEILALQTTKTYKIQQLLLLGLTRREVAQLITNNNYGFVQNVYAKMKEQGLFNTAAATLGFTLIPFNRKFGVEIEAYNVNSNTLAQKLTAAGINIRNAGYTHDTTSYWKIVSDSSISGQYSFELVSPILEGADGLQQLEIVCGVLRDCNAKVNKSTGLHIHFDARDMILENWKNLYKNYAKYESVIDSFMPISRRASNNTYCRSVNISHLFQKLDSARSVREITYIFERQTKINPHAFTRHGSIEFRHHSGTIEFEKISNWVTFLHNMVEFSKSNIENEPATIEGLAKFNQPNIIEFYKTRKQRLNA